ncbi:MAG: glycosyltransferase family 4 protein [Verrucomicrobiota bacterium JB023]|nr:glycosyltransferase family 4 protein [Verrucomicrobiota bacterium JB023]
MPNGFEDQAGEWKREAVGEGSPVKILSVGHLCREKGTPELIRAFGALQAEFPESELHLVGEPARDLNQEELDALCAETGVPERIIHRGLLRGEALQAAYQEADLFVFSTVAPYESFGMVLIEAMHWSLPIVATDWRANTEVCGPQLGGVVAREVEKDLAGSLERALRQALEQRSQWAEWGQANRRRYEEQFTTKKLEENLSTLLQ